MYHKVKSYIEEHEMIRNHGDVVLAGVSGGGDSMAMLDMLKKVQPGSWTFSLCAVHVHHGIRGEEADRDEALVQDTCRELGNSLFCPIIIQFWSLSKEMEDGNRRDRAERYDRKLLPGRNRTSGNCREKLFPGSWKTAQIIWNTVLPLHTMRTMLAETLIHNLCRGTGLQGLAAICAGKGCALSALFCVLNKQEIVNYLMERAYTLCDRQYQPDRGIHPEPYPSQDSSPSGK